ncbi:hypothetical protein NPIL_139221 [Nephila pilipes]|uniref:Uncharacterized protein n=1 Tax=Nephila pilipes TaxID=299642 RepID=A0A8X6NPY8_NEPPI|nr:hypothetical protein NPIL_46941 [Nephila pilipes]GFT51209.1 hypothetical protein NPIL_139221 [Nephila pilipes]
MFSIYLKPPKYKSTNQTNKRNLITNSNVVKPGKTFAQVITQNTQQLRAPLDQETAEATQSEPRSNIKNTQNPKPKRNENQTKNNSSFTIFEAVKELQSFDLFPTLLQTCESMSKVADKNDKLNLFFQVIVTQV